MNSYRTHTCSELRAANIGKPTTLIGWVDSVRDHGGVIFIDLRDRSGITQVVFHPEVNQDVAKASQQLRSEDMIQISGTVAARLKTDTVDTTNADLPTGEIEVSADTLNVINKADVLPFQLDRALSNEDLRLKYRFLDLRRPSMVRNMQIRHRVTKTTRDYLDEHGFLEIETPILSKSTPEGARDFLVPSRLAPGKFYALPQAPQQYKQLLMVAGMERYFQIARCFRDEDLRADRQLEFTQVDIEASFITPEDIYNLVEGLLKRVYKESLDVDIPTPFPRMTWREAMDQYGSDKPERRFGMKLTDVSSIFENSGFKVFASAVSNGGVVKAINAKGFGSASVGQIDALTKTAVEAGAKGLAYIKVARKTGEAPSPNSFPTKKSKNSRKPSTLKPETSFSLRPVRGNPPAISWAACVCNAPNSWNCLRTTRNATSCGSSNSRWWAGMRKNSAGWPSITPSPAPSRKTRKNCSRENSPQTCAPRLTTWCSTGRNWAAAPSESMNATCNPPCSRRSASRRNRPANNSATSWTPSASALRPTAALRWAWTAWS